MKRVLISQNENNNGTDYLIEDGNLTNDENKIIHYGKVFAKTDDWKKVYSDSFLEIRQKKNQILLKSVYNDKDIVGRVIYYMYLVNDSDSYKTILDFLKEDSQLINRTYDRARTLEIIRQVENNEKIKSNLIKGVAIAILAVASIAVINYLFSK